MLKLASASKFLKPESQSEFPQQVCYGYPRLLSGVSLPNGHRIVFKRVKVHSHTERSTDFVLAAVATPNCLCLVVVDHVTVAQVGVNLFAKGVSVSFLTKAELQLCTVQAADAVAELCVAHH